MKRGILFYDKDEAVRNSFFIDKLSGAFKDRGVNLELKYTEDSDEALLQMKEDAPCFVIDRGRDYRLTEKVEGLGIKTFNSSKLKKIANDKVLAYEELKDVVPMLSFIPEGKAKNDFPENELGLPFVIKSCSGHGGEEVFLINNREELADAKKKLKGKPFLYQKFCNTPGRDVRVYVVGNKVAKAMLRRSSTDFKSNFCLGGCALSYELTKDEEMMVKDICDRFYIDYAGIDFIFEDGAAVFNEIEDPVGARMLYSQTDIDIAEIFADHVIETISKQEEKQL